MIPPRDQWCIQIEITNACQRACANCTRLIGHGRSFYLGRWEFLQALHALREFVDLPPDRQGRRRVVGVMGGEPLYHPQFVDFCQLMRQELPEKSSRGLWTGLDWQLHPAADAIEDTFGYINNPRKDQVDCYHQPVLVASQDVVSHLEARQELQAQCWLQEHWSSSIGPKGFFFCEVAGALAWIFDGPQGLPVTPSCWRHDLCAYQEQLAWCDRCGICLYDRQAGRMVAPGLTCRRDKDRIDDVSQSNLSALEALGSRRIAAGQYQAYDPIQHEGQPYQTQPPWKYTG